MKNQSKTRKPDLLDAHFAGLADGKLGLADYEKWTAYGQPFLELYIDSYAAGREEMEVLELEEACA